MTLYDRSGSPTAYSEDGKHFFLFTGQPVAYFYENTVYGFNGHQFGWFENGWIRDLNGKCVLFSENSCSSDPAKPAKYAKAASAASWSASSGIQFFNQ
jgi:hypothetical protein